jgi:glycosyltransferase involved in cell wall biosynthesis
MRILFVCFESINKQGGTAVRLKEITSLWVKNGHDVLVLAPQYGRGDPLEWDAVVRSVKLPSRNVLFYLLYELSSLILVPWDVLRSKRDVVVTTGGVLSWILYSLVGLLKRLCVVELNGIADIEASRMHSSQVIAKLHAWIIRYSGLYKSADLFICVARGIRDEIVRRHPSVSEKSVIIGNGINASRFFIRDRSECRTMLGIDRSPFIFGFVGLLCPWHGTEDLITATKILKNKGYANFKTLIVGTGDRYEALRAQVIRDKVENVVHFAGRISSELVPIFMGCFNVACQVHNDPVVGRLGDSMKFWEYLASGLPVIVSDMSDSSRYVQQGKIGWKYSGGDPAALADRMEYAMGHPTELYTFEKANHDLAMNGHRWEDIADGMIRAIEGVRKRNAT